MVIASFPAVRTEFEIAITPIRTDVKREQIKIDAISFVRTDFIILCLPKSFFLLFLKVFPLCIPKIIQYRYLQNGIPVIFTFHYNIPC